MYSVSWLPLAKHDLENAVSWFVSELSAPDAALELLSLIDQAAAGLSQMPYRSAVYPVMVSLRSEIRLLPVKEYNLFYRVLESAKAVEILRVLHQRQQAKSRL